MDDISTLYGTIIKQESNYPEAVCDIEGDFKQVEL